MAERNPKRIKFTNPSHNLPDDNIFSIFSKSIVKSLLRFTSISKSINALIRSSAFMAMHHYNHVHNNNSNTIDTHLVFMPNDGHEAWQHCIFVPSRKYDKQCNLPWPFYLVGTCEGLICLAKDSDVYILNPCVGSMKTIPPHGSENDNVIYRFYFNKSSCGYKVIKQIFSGDASLINMEIYSLATNSWRRIQYKNSHCIFHINTMIIVKRFIYWKGLSRSNPESKAIILKFDLDEEVFEEMMGSYPSMGLKGLPLWRSRGNGVLEGNQEFAFYREPKWMYFVSQEYYLVRVKESLVLFDQKDKNRLWIWDHIPPKWEALDYYY